MMEETFSKSPRTILRDEYGSSVDEVREKSERKTPFLQPDLAAELDSMFSEMREKK